MTWLKRFAHTRGKATPGRIAREVLGHFYALGFVVLEANGQRLILSPSGRFDAGQRDAARNVGDMLAGALPEAGGACPQCGGRGFVLGPDLARTCINCEDLPGLVAENARDIGGLLMKGEQ